MGDDPTFCLYLRAFICCVTLLRQHNHVYVVQHFRFRFIVIYKN